MKVQKDLEFGPAGARLLRVALVTAALLVLAAAAYLIIDVLALVTPVTMAVIVALLLAALLGPVERLLRRWHVPRTPAALLSVLVLVIVVGGAFYLVGRRASGQIDDLRQQLIQGLGRLRHSVIQTMPGLSPARLDQIVADICRGLQQAAPSPIAGAMSTLEVVGAVLLAVLLLFFFLRDGDMMWSWLVSRTPGSQADRLDRAGRAAWHTLASYTHGIVAIAAVDAVGIGAALVLLHIPLALSLALLTFLCAFIPIVGATLAGAAAALVALVTNGPTDALLVLGAVILVQQLEGNLLHPVVMRRAVHLHPAVTLVAVGAGTLVAGVAGALIAVPVCAVTYHAATGYRQTDAPAVPPQQSDADSPAASKRQRSRKPPTAEAHGGEDDEVPK
jgi:predicted PurR-regulated permease PerM